MAQGYLKVARQHWKDCIVAEGSDYMDVRSPKHDLLVAARKNGAGSWHCAQKETGAKYPLAVLQAPDNLAKYKDSAKSESKASDAAPPAA